MYSLSLSPLTELKIGGKRHHSTESYHLQAGRGRANPNIMKHFLLTLFVVVSILNGLDVAAFTIRPSKLHSFPVTPENVALHRPSSNTRWSSSVLTALHAKKQKRKIKSGGGSGFGSKPAAAAQLPVTVSADKNSLEKQWDIFASITDLEITPPGNPDDEDYEHFIVADVFVRVGPIDGKKGTGWYRTGKAVAAGDDADILSSLILQRGLIFWTAVHMWPQLAAQGKEAAKNLQLGFMPPSLNMADETDGALDADDEEDVQILERVPVKGVSVKDIGFRPDFNPSGFTYKRRERAAMKKKKSALEEIAEAD